MQDIHWKGPWTVHGMYSGWYPGLHMAAQYVHWMVPWTVYCTVHWDVPLVCTSDVSSCTQICPKCVQKCTWTVCHMCSRCSGCAPAVHLDCTPNVLQLCSSCAPGPHTKCTPAVFQLCSRCIQLCSTCVQLCAEVSRCARVCTELYTILCTGLYTILCTGLQTGLNTI